MILVLPGLGSDLWRKLRTAFYRKATLELQEVFCTGEIDSRRLGEGLGVRSGACSGTSSISAQGHHNESGRPGWYAFSGLWNYCPEGCIEKSDLVDRIMKEVLAPLDWCGKP